MLIYVEVQRCDSEVSWFTEEWQTYVANLLLSETDLFRDEKTSSVPACGKDGLLQSRAPLTLAPVGGLSTYIRSQVFGSATKFLASIRELMSP
jgi:hypothetical protein